MATATLKAGQRVDISVTPTPLGADFPAPVVFSTSDTTILSVTPDTSGLRATVRALGPLTNGTPAKAFAKCTGLPDLVLDVTVIAAAVIATGWTLSVGAPY